MIKIKHINKYNKNKLKNYNGDQVGIIYKYNFENENNSLFGNNSVFSYDDSLIYNNIIDSNKFINENNKIEMYGGAPKKTGKKNDNACLPSKKIFSIKEIGTELLYNIVDNYPFIFRNNNIDDTKLLEIVYQLIKKKEYNLTNGEVEMIIRFLRENILTSIKNKIIQKHSLFETIRNELYMNSINTLITSENFINYKNKIMISKVISCEWEDLTSLANFENSFSFKENIIHPLFIILYGLKFPGIEDLSILQDYSSLVTDLKKDDFDGNNLFLLFLRISDLNYLPTNNSKFMSAVNNENLRINISMLLKEIAFSIRTGNFENKLSDTLLNYLSDIQHPNTKFKEENLIQSILSVFSFKPTLISKSQTFNNPLFKQINPFDNNIYSIPEAVYNIEYPINDFYSFNQEEIPVFSNINLKNIIYDPVTKKVIFSYNNNTPIDKNNIQENLLNNLYKCVNTTKQEVNFNDISSTILSTSLNLEEMYKESSPVNVLLTNGLFIISIPRETIRYINNPRQNLFYITNRKQSINISPILVEQNININKINYFLAGGLCYDILENTNSCHNFGLNYVKNETKIGTYSIIKLSNNKWIEYNPNIFLTNSRIFKFIEKALRNNFEYKNPSYSQNDEPVPYEIWVENNKENIIKKILNHQVSLIDMYISEEEAIEKLSMYANLIFYKEPYLQYKTRNEMKY